MAEGFFHPNALQVPNLTSDVLCAAMVRILPRTILVLDLAPTADDARRLGRNESRPDGAECWHRFFTAQDVARVDDPEFATGMVRHEFVRVVKAGGQFPATVPLDGGGSGFTIDSAGHVLTNFHLVTSEVANHRREEGAIGQRDRCTSLRAQTAFRSDEGRWEWRDAESLWLVSNPPLARALREDDTGLSQPREDTALLQVVPAPQAHLCLSTEAVEVSEPLWMAGFPLRSARSRASREAVGYADADGTLRVSSGRVLAVDGDGYFISDVDGSMGNSGSPVFNARGRVVGMFSRASGDGPRNAFEYGHLNRVQVSARLAVQGLQLASLQPVGG